MIMGIVKWKILDYNTIGKSPLTVLMLNTACMACIFR